MNLDELHFLARRLKEATEEAMTAGRDLGLSPAQGVVMADLLRNGPSPINEITHRTGFAQSRISTAVAELQERGWVLAQTDPADRRRTIADVTPEIRRNARRATGRRAEPVLDRLLGGLEASRRAEVLSALELLYAVLRTEQPHDGPASDGAGARSAPTRQA